MAFKKKYYKSDESERDNSNAKIEKSKTYSKSKSFNSKSDRKVNTSKTGPADIFSIYASNDNELKIESQNLGSLSGEIKLTPYNYTVIHDIDNYPIIGTPISGKSVLSGGQGEVGSILARFKDQLQFPLVLNQNELLHAAQQAEVDIAHLAQLAPMITHKVLKVNPYGVHPLYFPGVKPVTLGYNDARQNNKVRLLPDVLYATEKHLTKKLEEMYLPLQDTEGTEFDIYNLFVRFNRKNQNNNNTVQSEVKDGNQISPLATNALGYYKYFYDKYVAAIDNIFTRLNIFTKASEHVRHISRLHNRIVNDLGTVLNSSMFRGAVASLMDSRLLLRSLRNFNKNHTSDLNVVSKATNGRTTALDIVTTTYFNFRSDTTGAAINDPTVGQYQQADQRWNFTYNWSNTSNAWEVNDETDFVADIVFADSTTAQPTVILSVAQQQQWVNHVLRVYALLEPTNIPWSNMMIEDWRQWRANFIDAIGIVARDIIAFNQAMMPYLQVLSRCESYSLDTGYTVGTDENYNVVMSTAIAQFSGSMTTKILNDLTRVTALPNPADGTTVEAEYNQCLFNSIISDNRIQYFTGEPGLYHPFYYIGSTTGMVTATAGVGYTLVSNTTNTNNNKPVMSDRQCTLSLVLLQNTGKIAQNINRATTALNLFVNYSSRIDVRIANNVINTIYDSTSFGTVDYHVNTLYNEVIKMIEQTGLKTRR